MLHFDSPVKYLGTESRSGVSKATGKDYELTEAKLFVPDLGRIKVLVNGNPSLPEVGSTIQLALSVDQGRYQSLSVVWDESAQFKVVGK